MADELIFEIGCEEIPASYIEPALRQMRELFAARCKEARIAVDGLRVMGAPRRLVLLAESVATRQEDLEEERVGPPASVAEKNPRAVEGFARGQGVDPADLYEVETDKGRYLAARVREEGRPTAELLPELLGQIPQQLDFPKSMRWGTHTERFARPVRWIVASLGGQTLPLQFAGVASGATTRGHRFVGKGGHQEVEVRSISSYLDGLRAAHVEPDQVERRKRIRELLGELGQEAGGQVVDDPALVEEVVHLVEWPVGVLVRFDERYLELPDEVLVSSMRGHQRYFAIRGDSGALLPACAVISNTPVPDEEVVRTGNLRVLKARLDDAFFFWEQDRQRRLDERLEALEQVIWVQGLGDQRARSRRLGELAALLAQALGLDQVAAEQARRAGLLSRADLITQMVGEFPDLQGVMGREYARQDGEPEAVAVAIEEQYMPRSADGQVPKTDVGAALALAERADALVGLFGIGEVPTSSADPFGLRRAAIGLLRILQERGYGLTLGEVVRLARGLYDDDQLTTAPEALEAQLVEFIKTRLRGQLVGQYATDVVDAVLAASDDEVLSVADRAEALDQLRGEPDFEPLAIGFKRVVNILRKQADAQFEIPQQVDPERLEQGEERALLEAAEQAEARVEQALGARQWSQACQALISLRQPIDAFFDEVMVMTDDEALRANRLALLDRLRRLFFRVADLSRIGG